jgi:hypothetical protein
MATNEKNKIREQQHVEQVERTGRRARILNNGTNTYASTRALQMGPTAPAAASRTRATYTAISKLATDADLGVQAEVILGPSTS